jgi:SAM-dependent methyltransferase
MDLGIMESAQLTIPVSNGGGSAAAGQFIFACPECRARLEPVGEDAARCPQEGVVYRREAGIWRFLSPEREAYYRQFMQDYETVRQGEGRGYGGRNPGRGGAVEAAYYQSLPFADLSGLRAAEWAIRARSFRAFRREFLIPLEDLLARPLKILDLGSGCGWLAYRMACRGHSVAAIDLIANTWDGLGAHSHYDAFYQPVQADFDHLPFAAGQFDLAIFNASFHYSTDYETTLRESLRLLHGRGLVILLDSPVYQDESSGRQMVQEREAQFLAAYGFRSNAIPSENYLTSARLQALGQSLSLQWQVVRPFYGLGWALRPVKARLLGRREPAAFLVLAGRQRIFSDALLGDQDMRLSTSGGKPGNNKIPGFIFSWFPQISEWFRRRNR